MAGGAYVALSGLRSRAEHLERLASDIANADTAGYKATRSTTVVAERPTFAQALASAVDVAAGPQRIDFRAGSAVTTGRDLDFAIEGPGFFVVRTPYGDRYTRNGHFTRAADGTLTTPDGDPVLGADGPLRLPAGPIEVGEGGEIRSGDTVVGHPRVVQFADPHGLAREEGARFRAPAGTAPEVETDANLRAGMLEESNVSVIERMAQLTELSRTFESLQRGLSVLMNDMDGRAIVELGRR